MFYFFILVIYLSGDIMKLKSLTLKKLICYLIFIFIEKEQKLIFKGLLEESNNSLNNTYDALKKNLSLHAFAILSG